jgi:16S rRNA G966 N2-methylase RsmD
MDLVFLDPPFDAGLYEKLLAQAAPLLSERGRVYLEAPTAWNDAQLAPYGLAVHRYLKAGAVHAHLLRQSDNLPQQTATTAPDAAT